MPTSNAAHIQTTTLSIFEQSGGRKALRYLLNRLQGLDLERKRELLADMPAEILHMVAQKPMMNEVLPVAFLEKLQQQKAKKEAQREKQAKEQLARKDFLAHQWNPAVTAWAKAHSDRWVPTTLMVFVEPQDDPTTWTEDLVSEGLKALEITWAAWWVNWEKQWIQATPEAIYGSLKTVAFEGRRTLTVAQLPKLLAGRGGRTLAQWRAFFAPWALARQEAARVAKAQHQQQVIERRAQQTQEREARQAHAAWEASLLGVAEVAAYAGCSSSTVRADIQKGLLPIAMTRGFRKWGRSLETTYHTPEAVRVWGRTRGVLELSPNTTGAPLPLDDAAMEALVHQPLPGPDGPRHQVWPTSWVKHWQQQPDPPAAYAADVARWHGALTTALAKKQKAWNALHRATWSDHMARVVQSALPAAMDPLWGRKTPASIRNIWKSWLDQQLVTMFEQAEIRENQILTADFSLMPETWFPQARTKTRRWEVFLGPTNSGKTYQAMQHLLTAPTGIYLAPLRLMALEAYDTLRDHGLNAGLMTGEELRENGEGSPTHWSATIETLSPDTAWHVAVIDEAQMLADDDRGWAWTQALLGINADTLCVCAAPAALGTLRALAKRLGEPVTVHHLGRSQPLAVLEEPIKLTDLQMGDAIIGFSRTTVLAYREWLRNNGRTVACLYGDLGPEVRQKEAQRFRDGEAQVLVATDAIGMGLNLPIRRILFAALEKYDGTSQRYLHPSEVQQIGGRAGRRGFHEQGWVGVLSERARTGFLKHQMASSITPVSTLWPVRPRPEQLLAMAEATGKKQLVPVLKVWLAQARAQGLQDSYDLSSTVRWRKDGWLQQLSNSRLPLKLQLAYSGCPVRPTQHLTVIEWASLHHRQRKVQMPQLRGWSTLGQTPDSLRELEQYALFLSTYRWLARHFPHVYVEHEALTTRHAQVQKLIAQALAKAGLDRLCISCGTSLPLETASSGFRKCQDCFEDQRGYRGRWNEDEEDWLGPSY